MEIKPTGVPESIDVIVKQEAVGLIHVGCEGEVPGLEA